MYVCVCVRARTYVCRIQFFVQDFERTNQSIWMSQNTFDYYCTKGPIAILFVKGRPNRFKDMRQKKCWMANYWILYKGFDNKYEFCLYFHELGTKNVMMFNRWTAKRRLRFDISLWKKFKISKNSRKNIFFKSFFNIIALKRNLKTAK